MKLKSYPKIIIDNREQKPYFYDKLNSPHYPGLDITHGTLKTGDYSIEGMSNPSDKHSITIERKSLQDLFLSTGKGRDRFEREFKRMSKFDYAAVVVESELSKWFLKPPILSKMNPKSVFRTMIISWSIRYGVPCIPCQSRAFAEKTTYLLLMKFWLEKTTNAKR